MMRRNDETRDPCRRAGGALAVLLLAACGGGNNNPGDPIDAMPDDQGPPPRAHWSPRPGETKNWDIQLNDPIDVSEPRQMYILDLWRVVPAPTMIDYGDADPVAVPAGTHAGLIAQLKARTPAPIVVCHVKTGALELERPDARKFPGYKPNAAQIPNNPTPPEADSVIGWQVGTTPMRWLDLREATRGKWASIMFKRFELAKQIGCDAIDPDRNTGVQFATGFSPAAIESYGWFKEVARQGHAQNLSIGMHNGHGLAGQVDHVVESFDWMLIEGCGETDTCDTTRTFLMRDKTVFALDYTTQRDGTPNSTTAMCDLQLAAQIPDGIVKDLELTKNVRMQCLP